MILNILKSTLILIVLIWSIGIAATPASAQTDGYNNDTNSSKRTFIPMSNIPLLESWQPGQSFESDTSNVFNQLFSLSIRIGAMLAVFMFIWGGLNMVMARDNASSITEGRRKMKNAVFGLLMLLSTFVVLNTINPQLVNVSIFDGVGIKLGETTETTEYYDHIAKLYNDKNGDLLDYLACGMNQLQNGVTNLECFNTIEQCIANYRYECNLYNPETTTISFCFLTKDESGNYVSNCSSTKERCKNNAKDYGKECTSMSFDKTIFDIYGPTQTNQ
jgi:hypothetical protein